MNITGNPLIDTALKYRGITSAEDINYSIAKLLPISQLNFVEDVAKAIFDAITSKKRIVIIADYDCDGVTAGAVMIRMLRSLNADLAWLIPDRAIHGYGLTPELVDFAYQGWVNGSVETQTQIETQIKQRALEYIAGADDFVFATSEQIIDTSTHYIQTVKPDVIVTVDNGIASVAGVDRANELGIEVIVTDHHLAGTTLPKAKAIVNPNHPDCTFASKSLCGVGVAWYVCAALSRYYTEKTGQKTIPVISLLPYVAFGTVADVVTLDFNNRLLIQSGFNVLKKSPTKYLGLSTLMSIAKIDVEKLNTAHIGFQLGPRLNAAGRISHMGIGLLNLITEDLQIAAITARQLDYLNTERKLITSNVQYDAQEMLTEANFDSTQFVLVAHPEKGHWHEGVIGIVAGRLKEEYNKPAIALTYLEESNVYKGSCRSIPVLNMKDLLDEVARRDPTILMKFGGHAMAAGLTIYGDKLNDFIYLINKIAKEWLKESDFNKIAFYDYEPKHFEINVKNIQELNSMIWGQNFPEPLFKATVNIREVKRIGADGQHIKLTCALDGYQFAAIKFNAPDWEPNIHDTITILFKLGLNEWNDKVNVQLMIEHYDLSDITVKCASEKNA